MFLCVLTGFPSVLSCSFMLRYSVFHHIYLPEHRFSYHPSSSLMYPPDPSCFALFTHVLLCSPCSRSSAYVHQVKLWPLMFLWVSSCSTWTSLMFPVIPHITVFLSVSDYCLAFPNVPLGSQSFPLCSYIFHMFPHLPRASFLFWVSPDSICSLMNLCVPLSSLVSPYVTMRFFFVHVPYVLICSFIFRVFCCVCQCSSMFPHVPLSSS